MPLLIGTQWIKRIYMRHFLTYIQLDINAPQIDPLNSVKTLILFELNLFLKYTLPNMNLSKINYLKPYLLLKS